MQYFPLRRIAFAIFAAILVAAGVIGLMRFRQRLPACISGVRPFRLNSYTAGDQRWPEIAVAEDGSQFVAAWASKGQFLDGGWTVVARRFDLHGNPLGDEFRVDDWLGDTFPSSEDPSVDFDDAGNFAIAWHAQDRDGDDGGWTIMERHFRPDGTPFGDGSLVPTRTVYEQYRPTMLVTGDGTSLVTWYSTRHEFGQGADITSEIRGRLYKPDGSAHSTEIRISGATDLNRTQWRMGAVNRNGIFVSYWYDSSVEGGTIERLVDPEPFTYARVVDRDGNLLSPEIGFRRWINVGVAGSGDWLVVMSGNRFSTGGKAQWYDPEGNPIGAPFPAREGEIAMWSNGDFVVLGALPDERSDLSRGACAWFYDADGNLIGDPLYLTEGHTNIVLPHIDMNEHGDIVVIWESTDDSDGYDIWAVTLQHPPE